MPSCIPGLPQSRGLSILMQQRGNDFCVGQTTADIRVLLRRWVTSSQPSSQHFNFVCLTPVNHLSTYSGEQADSSSLSNLNYTSRLQAAIHFLRSLPPSLERLLSAPNSDLSRPADRRLHPKIPRNGSQENICGACHRAGGNRSSGDRPARREGEQNSAGRPSKRSEEIRCVLSEADTS